MLFFSYLGDVESYFVALLSSVGVSCGLVALFRRQGRCLPDGKSGEEARGRPWVDASLGLSQVQGFLDLLEVEG